MDIKRSAVAEIEDGNIVIRVAAEALPDAVKFGCDLGYIEGHWKVTDTAALAKEMVYALNDEDEEGTTPIHRLLDKAIDHVLEQGGDGIDKDDEPDID